MQSRIFSDPLNVRQMEQAMENFFKAGMRLLLGTEICTDQQIRPANVDVATSSVFRVTIEKCVVNLMHMLLLSHLVLCVLWKLLGFFLVTIRIS